MSVNSSFMYQSLSYVKCYSYLLYSPRSKQVILLLTPHSDILFCSITIFKSLWVPSFQINTFYTHDQTRSSPIRSTKKHTHDDCSIISFSLSPASPYIQHLNIRNTERYGMRKIIYRWQQHKMRYQTYNMLQILHGT